MTIVLGLHRCPKPHRCRFEDAYFPNAITEKQIGSAQPSFERGSTVIVKAHFISGLPRAGSTLLSALLKQNPRFHASVTSPVAMLVTTLMNKMSGGNEFSVFFDDERRRSVLKIRVL